jgi:hypothetical protein
MARRPSQRIPMSDRCPPQCVPAPILLALGQQSCVPGHGRHAEYGKRPCSDAAIDQCKHGHSRLLRFCSTHRSGPRGSERTGRPAPGPDPVARSSPNLLLISFSRTQCSPPQSSIFPTASAQRRPSPASSRHKSYRGKAAVKWRSCTTVEGDRCCRKSRQHSVGTQQSNHWRHLLDRTCACRPSF